MSDVLEKIYKNLEVLQNVTCFKIVIECYHFLVLKVATFIIVAIIDKKLMMS